MTIKYLTVNELLDTVDDIPYYNNVLCDYDLKDYTWEVTQKVLQYAHNFQANPDEIDKLPPIYVVNGSLKDGAHRICAVYLLQERFDVSWKDVQLKVNFQND
jgi:RAB protein geranylgeranyltransferase component A